MESVRLFPPAAILNAGGYVRYCSIHSSKLYILGLRHTIMLYLVGLGLADETDITVKGLEVVKAAKRVYLEAYTSILLVDKEKLVIFAERIYC